MNLTNLKKSFLTLTQDEKIKTIEEIRNRKLAIERAVAKKPVHKKIKEKMDLSISNLSMMEIDSLIAKLKGL